MEDFFLFIIMSALYDNNEKDLYVASSIVIIIFTCKPRIFSSLGINYTLT